ncbi:hypothetical protein Barb4_00056 [Bacteroidales bacterium Barb4]|nr:hypothetical protein Barb4_00056 [Bacteroidales bacterium Barb4]
MGRQELGIRLPCCTGAGFITKMEETMKLKERFVTLVFNLATYILTAAVVNTLIRVIDVPINIILLAFAGSIFFVLVGVIIERGMR